MGPGLATTIVVSVLVMLLGLAVGLLGGLSLLYGPRVLRFVVRAYVDLVRGTPLLVLVFLIFYGIPAVGIPVPNLLAAVIALGAFAGAQISELVRGGVSSIPRGQSDAAMALGLTFWPRLTRVVLPQAVARILPPLVNTTVEVVKGSSLVSLVSIVELTLATQQVVQRVQRPVPLYATAALLYFAVNLIVSSGGRRLERRFAY
ncbi:MAG: amino acid ABC transporter permease [Chloroflexi bacterium]|nr:amino acid ABC transporter permease [Chloroflexota bacterium]